VLLGVASIIGLASFLWPFFVTAHAGQNNAHSTDAPWIFLILVPLLLGIVFSELADGSMDAKAVALLGILGACIAALRVPAPGAYGFEPMWFLLVLSARVFGRGFGFVLGALAFLGSALISGGVGPWLPFQMFAAAWFGFGAGCLPPVRGARERFMLAGYGAFAAIGYGWLTNLWFWPFVGTGTTLSYEPNAGMSENVHRFIAFNVASSIVWDVTRAAMTVVLILILGRPVLAALRRATRRAVFEPVVVFTTGSASGDDRGSATPDQSGVLSADPAGSD
jgi:energy-coupling factor transport system substrate-specific component